MNKERKAAWHKGEKVQFRLCVEIQNIAKNEHGNPCPCGACLELDGVAKEDTTYNEILAGIEPAELIQMFFLGGIVSPEDIRIISPEEYDEKYGNEEG